MWAGFDVCTATSQARQTGKCWWSTSIRLALGTWKIGASQLTPSSQLQKSVTVRVSTMPSCDMLD